MHKGKDKDPGGDQRDMREQHFSGRTELVSKAREGVWWGGLNLYLPKLCNRAIGRFWTAVGTKLKFKR